MSPTAKQRDADRHPTSYRVLVVPLPSACEVAGAGAAGAEVAQPASTARASIASAVLMNYVLSRPPARDGSTESQWVSVRGAGNVVLLTCDSRDSTEVQDGQDQLRRSDRGGV